MAIFIISSWGKAFPSLMLNCSRTASRHENPMNVYTLNPLSAEAVDLVAAVLQQLAGVFPSRYFHVGGDEVVLDCWDEDQMLRAAKGNTSNWIQARHDTIRLYVYLCLLI